MKILGKMFKIFWGDTKKLNYEKILGISKKNCDKPSSTYNILNEVSKEFRNNFWKSWENKKKKLKSFEGIKRKF